MAHLTCPQRWVQYLQLLQESIWPDGALPKCPRPVRTPEQKAAAEKQALQSLMGVLPGDCREADGAIALLPTSLSCHYPTPFPCFQRALSVAGLRKCIDLPFLRPTGKVIGTSGDAEGMGSVLGAGEDSSPVDQGGA